jgi:hypothetical protein
MLSSGVTKIILLPPVVEGLHGVVGVPKALLPVLGLLLIAGAVGLVAGNLRPKLGLAAASGLTLYFIGAICAHLLAGDYAGVMSPIVPLLLSVGSFFLARKNVERAE